MNNPLALCELAARAPNISAGHKLKQDWLPNDRVFILDLDCYALLQGSLSASNSANRHWITHFALSDIKNPKLYFKVSALSCLRLMTYSLPLIVQSLNCIKTAGVIIPQNNDYHSGTREHHVCSGSKKQCYHQHGRFIVYRHDSC